MVAWQTPRYWWTGFKIRKKLESQKFLPESSCQNNVIEYRMNKCALPLHFIQHLPWFLSKILAKWFSLCLSIISLKINPVCNVWPGKHRSETIQYNRRSSRNWYVIFLICCFILFTFVYLKNFLTMTTWRLKISHSNEAFFPLWRNIILQGYLPWSINHLHLDHWQYWRIMSQRSILECGIWLDTLFSLLALS